MRRPGWCQYPGARSAAAANDEAGGNEEAEDKADKDLEKRRRGAAEDEEAAADRPLVGQHAEDREPLGRARPSRFVVTP